MKSLHIIVEGQTEQEFVRELLIPYFQKHRIYSVYPTLIKASGGGVSKYEQVQQDIAQRLRESENNIVTTFLDFFRLPNDFPDSKKCHQKNNSAQMVDCLEKALAKDFDNNPRFIPYIQRHEFEALLFSSNQGFEEYHPSCISKKTAKIIEKFSNPEDINGNPNTAPSKRLIQLFKECEEEYDKVQDGNMIALEIGLETIFHKCPGFKKWIESLVQIMII